MERAVVIGKIIKPQRVADWKKPLKVQFGSILRKTLSANRIPVNRCGRQ